MSTTPWRTRHGRYWSPETPLGRWALSLAGLSLAGNVALAIAFSAGVERADSFTDDWLLIAAGVAIFTTAVASAATGSLAMVLHHDRTWSVVSATALGALVTALTLQQVAAGLGWLSR